MYKLLIVDDEQIVVDSVKFIVEKFMSGSLITDTARSGRESIEKAETFRPDIVITDIKMPGINGLEAITEIKKIHSGAFFIIITAYANFDFAKEALQLGAIEYINKPLSRAKVINALENAIKLKDKERSKLKTELDFKEKMSFILPALENSFIYSIIFSDDHTLEMKSLKKILNLDCDNGCIMTIEFGEGKDSDGMINKIGSSIKSQKIYPLLRDAIKESCKCIVGPVMLNRIIVYIPCDIDTDEYRQRIETINTGTEIYEKLQSAADNVDFYIGIGNCYPALRDIYKSYEESIKAIGYAKESGVVHINDIPVERGLKITYPQNIENTLLKKITAGETEESLISFGRFFSWLREEYNDNLNEIKSNLTELVVMIWRISKDYGLDNSSDMNGNYIMKFLSINDIKVMKNWLKDYIWRISNSMIEVRDKKLSTVIKSAVNYISKKYSSDITLEDVSMEVNVSPTYFSKLFKEETGTNFIDYLTVLRIEKAKELIRGSNHGNKEICCLIGYSDPNYFSRVFKKMVGVTPTEYRDTFINS